MKKINLRIKELFKNKLLKNVILVSSGASIAQGLNIIVAPIITRIYSPEDFGVLTTFTAILSILIIISSMKYEWGIPIAENDETAFVLVILSFLITIITAIFVFIVLYILGGFNHIFSISPIILKYRFLLSLGVLISGTYMILIQWGIRNKNFKDISKTKLSQSIFQITIKIMFGILFFGPIGLLIGRAISQLIGVIYLIKKSFKNILVRTKDITFVSLFKIAVRYKKFPFYTAPSQLLNTLGLQLPVIFITVYFGLSEVGIYGLAVVMVSLPITLIGKSIGDVFFAEAAKDAKTNPARIKKVSNKVVLNMIYIGLIPTVILVLFAPSIFAFVFGDEWYYSGIYVRVLASMIFFKFVFTPLTRIFIVFEKQAMVLVLDIIRVLSILLVFIISNYLGFSSVNTIIIYSGVMIIIYIMSYLIALHVLNNSIKDFQENSYIGEKI